MTWYVDLLTQVRRILPWRFGGTGNDQAAALYTVRKMSVRQDEDVLRGYIVRSREVDKADVVDDHTVDDAVGVVLGQWLDSGKIDRFATAGQFDFVAVVTAGICEVLLEEDVDAGEYAFPADTPGTARGETDPDVGMIGRFVGMGSAGGYALVKLGGGGGGGGTGASYTDAQCEATFLLPSAGSEVYTRVPWDGTITGWAMTGDDASGSAVVDLYLAAFASYPPGSGDSITGSAPPTLATDDHEESATLTGWTTAVTKDDVLVFHVDSVSIHQRLTVSLILDRSS
jgi:hypothetical protein